jgi:FKBP-type peptidyl-prolyl cis-trans isomerase FklB
MKIKFLVLAITLYAVTFLEAQDLVTRERWERHRDDLSKMQRTIEENNKKESELFFSENRKKDGVVQLSNGIQYKIIKNGNGPRPTEANKIEVLYKCLLIDGTEISIGLPLKYAPLDTWIKNPDVIPLSEVLPELKLVIMLMPIGSRWQIFLPLNPAYSYVMHIYEIELIRIVEDNSSVAQPLKDN